MTEEKPVQDHPEVSYAKKYIVNKQIYFLTSFCMLTACRRSEIQVKISQQETNNNGISCEKDCIKG